MSQRPQFVFQSPNPNVPSYTTPAYDTVLISASQPYIINRKGANFLYLYSSIAMALTIVDYGSAILPANEWTLMGWPEGARVTANQLPAPMYIYAIVTNEPLYSDPQNRHGLNAYERAGFAFNATAPFLSGAGNGTITGFGLFLKADTPSLQVSANINIVSIKVTCYQSIIGADVVVSQNITAPTAIQFTTQASVNNNNLYLTQQNAATVWYVPPGTSYSSSFPGTIIKNLGALRAGETYDFLDKDSIIITKGKPATVICFVTLPYYGAQVSGDITWYEEP